MDRRSFLKGVAGAAAVAAAANVVPGGEAQAEAATPQRLTLAAVGDLLLCQRISDRRDPGFLALRDLLHGVDCAWGNCEVVLADANELYPMPKGGDPHTIAPPWVADEMKWLGIDFVGTANNHIVDFGHEGLFSTLRHLERVGIPQAGSGADLPLAARPGYLDTPAGRVGQVNACSTFRDYFPASPPHPYLKGRPGLNPLNIDYNVKIDRELFQRLKKVEVAVGREQGQNEFREITELLGEAPEDQIYISDYPITRGDRLELLSPAREADVKRIAEAVKVARRNSRLVLATLHAHECQEKLEIPSPFQQPFARACIDAGAGAFLAAGPHVLRGIEIYKGKPIFHGLGNFFFQIYTMEPMPAEAFASWGLDPNTLDISQFGDRIVTYQKQKRFWETFLPIVAYEGDDLASIELYPVELGFAEAPYHRGLPTLARGEEAASILGRLAELSKPFGTRIEVRDGVGHVVLG